MIGIVVKSERDAHYVRRIQQGRKTRTKGELDGTTRCVTRYSRGVALTEIIITELNCL